MVPIQCRFSSQRRANYQYMCVVIISSRFCSVEWPLLPPPTAMFVEGAFDNGEAERLPWVLCGPHFCVLHVSVWAGQSKCDADLMSVPRFLADGLAFLVNIVGLHQGLIQGIVPEFDDSFLGGVDDVFQPSHHVGRSHR